MDFRRILSAALLSLALVVIPILAPPAMAQDLCGPQWPYGTRGADPVALAAAWLPLLERLSDSIPSLSPREAEWLDAEMRGDGGRSVRAVSSREFALQRVKNNTSSLLASTRNLLNEKRTSAQKTQDWLFFAYNLIDEDSDLYLAGLVTEKVIPLKALPEEWKSPGTPLQESIRWARMGLARHVLICTLRNRLPER
jgi:hypothetical protein